MTIQFTVGCNWDPKLIDGLDFPEVASLFGGLPDTVISGGRHSSMIKSLKRNEVKDYIQKVRQKGWDFDFNINSACMANKELSSAGHREIIGYLESIIDLGVTSLTVSIPNLLMIIKKYFPQIKTKISTFQKVDNVAMAKYFEDIGADAIMLSEHINRDLELLKSIREAVNCKLVIIANVGCLYGCPNMHTHANSIAHNGAKGGTKRSFGVETYQLFCNSCRLKDPTEFVKSRWIRPEDLPIYEEIGIDLIKIIDRHTTTADLITRTKAYHERSYEGNFIDIMGQIMNLNTGTSINPRKILMKAPPWKRRKMGAFMKNMRVYLSDLVYLDTKKIPDDFVYEISKRNCRSLSCKQCGYCHAIAAQAVRFSSEEARRETLARLIGLREQLTNGSALV